VRVHGREKGGSLALLRADQKQTGNPPPAIRMERLFERLQDDKRTLPRCRLKPSFLIKIMNYGHHPFYT
jgi:hypothetical protein